MMVQFAKSLVVDPDIAVPSPHDDAPHPPSNSGARLVRAQSEPGLTAKEPRGSV